MSDTTGREKLQAWVDQLVKAVDAEQAEASITTNKWALTRFANSTIHQNMASENTVVHLRAVLGKKVASLTTNITSDQDLLRAARDVVTMARNQDDNPDFVSLPEPAKSRGYAESYSDATAASAPEQRAKLVHSVIERSDRVGGAAAGSLSVGSYERAVANSLGIRSYQRGTSANITTVCTGPDGGFGYASAVSGGLGDIDAEALGEESAQRASLSRNPSDLDPGEYECILSPYAAGNALSMFTWMGFTGLAYQEGRSFVCGKLGEKIADESISMRDDGLDPRTIVNSYDGEGVPKQRVDLISRGVASGLLYDSYSAHKEGKRSTGHAGGMNVIVEPGKSTVEEMISSTKRGVLVTRFHYTNVSHLMTASITGMTRDGTFLIENGRIKGPVKNLRFTQSVLEALSNVQMIGGDPKLVGGIFVPSLKIGKWRFTSATEF